MTDALSLADQLAIRDATLSGTLQIVEAPAGTFVEAADIDGRVLTIGLRVARPA